MQSGNYLFTAGRNPAFVLEFADVRDQTGYGFDDPAQGAARRAIAITVFELISSVLDGETGTAKIRFDSRSPMLNPETLAVGVPYFQCTDGFQKPIIFEALRNDTHVHEIEGELLVNFSLPLSTVPDGPGAGEFDLFTVIFHETIHILGFVGFSVESDGRPRDCGGARMLPAIARHATDSQGSPLWLEQNGTIRYNGTAAQLPSGSQPQLLDLPSATSAALRLATGPLRVSGHWLPEDFPGRKGVLMLKEPFPTGQTRRNLTPETVKILKDVLGYTLNQDLNGLSGSWVDPGLDGQGFSIQFISGQRLVFYFFGFTDNGDRLWLLGIHDDGFQPGDSITVPMIEAAGGRFNHFNEVNISESPWGTLDIRFFDCFNAEATLTGLDGSQAMTLYQLARVDGLNCY